MYCEINDVVGMDKEVIGIFDLEYLKRNKETHEKEWRNNLVNTIHITEDNPKYVDYYDSPMHKAFFKKMEAKKDALKRKYQYAPEYLTVIDEITNYDPEQTMSSSSLLQYNYVMVKYMTDFFEGKKNAYKKYLASDISKKTLDKYMSTCFEEQCFITRPSMDNNIYTCVIGLNDRKKVEAVIVDFEEPEDDEEEELQSYEVAPDMGYGGSYAVRENVLTPEGFKEALEFALNDTDYKDSPESDAADEEGFDYRYIDEEGMNDAEEELSEEELLMKEEMKSLGMDEDLEEFDDDDIFRTLVK